MNTENTLVRQLDRALRDDNERSQQFLRRFIEDRLQGVNTWYADMSLLARAVAYDARQTVLWLIRDMKADVDRRCKDEHTPLMVAAKLGHYEVAEMLVRNGACVDLQDKKGRTALTIAAIDDNWITVKTLLELGADPNIVDGEGKSPLMHACGRGLINVVQLLLAARADTTLRDTRKDRTAYLFAKEKGHLDVIKVVTP